MGVTLLSSVRPDENRVPSEVDVLVDCESEVPADGTFHRYPGLRFPG
jgi:hypothetical protein